MDLRHCKLSAKQIERAAQVLDYQPFIITDEIQTGAAYSWVYSDDPRVAPPLVFRRKDWNGQWEKITAANGNLREMYNDFIDEIVARYPHGSVFDAACNNGYFPVRASCLGMKNCLGSDLGAHHANSINFLNDVLETEARFIHAPYDPVSGQIPCQERFDVVVASAIMCHLPNPLNFLAALGSLAKEAIFFWGQMLDTDELLVAYSTPHANLSDTRPFPFCFNDNTRISKGMFREAARLMGFREVVFLTARSHWFFANSPASDLETEARIGSPHVAALAIR
jgi:hypothetical protein